WASLRGGDGPAAAPFPLSDAVRRCRGHGMQGYDDLQPKSHMRPDFDKYLNLGMVKRARHLLTARNVRRGCINTHVARDPSNAAAVAWTATGKGYHHGLQELGPSQHLEEVPDEGVFTGA